jgi:hypothetical protein
MVSLEDILQSKLTDELKREFRKFCLLLQALSDDNSWVYECDFYLTDSIYWGTPAFYGGGSEELMSEPIKNYFQKIIQKYITVDNLWGYIDEKYENRLTETGWLYFTLFPKVNKLNIELTYNYQSDNINSYEEEISTIVELYSRGNEDDVQKQLNEWKQNNAIFEVYYQGSNFNSYVDNECKSNIGITKIPDVIERLSEILINLYERGYHLERDGGDGTIEFDFGKNYLLMEHRQYETRHQEVDLGTLNF